MSTIILHLDNGDTHTLAWERHETLLGALKSGRRWFYLLNYSEQHFDAVDLDRVVRITTEKNHVKVSV